MTGKFETEEYGRFMDSLQLWKAIDAERARLGALLQTLSRDQWRQQSLCANWDIEKVVAHLSAASSTGSIRWLLNMFRSGFNSDVHNERLLTQEIGRTTGETLSRYQRTEHLRRSPLNTPIALLGEIVVHGQDICRPLEISLSPTQEAVFSVLQFYSSKDFAVNSRTLVSGLSLKATDSDFSIGDGPLVYGTQLDLIMAMASRPQALPYLGGEGVEDLRLAMERN